MAAIAAGGTERAAEFPLLLPGRMCLFFQVGDSTAAAGVTTSADRCHYPLAGPPSAASSTLGPLLGGQRDRSGRRPRDEADAFCLAAVQNVLLRLLGPTTAST